MNSFFDEQTTFLDKLKRHQVGVYITIIVHLFLIFTLLLYKVTTDGRNEKMSILLDFSKENEIEREQKEIEEKEKIENEVNEMLNLAKHTNEPIRNISVNSSDEKVSELKSSLKDDKGINNSVYEDAKRLQENLAAGREYAKQMQASLNENTKPKKNAKNEQSAQSGQSYGGQTTVEANLDGRSGIYLPSPAYKCQGGGVIVTNIEVDRGGYVVSASIDNANSEYNECLRNAALRAARVSRFEASNTAPQKQSGTIIYRFIPQ